MVADIDKNTRNVVRKPHIERRKINLLKDEIINGFKKSNLIS